MSRTFKINLTQETHGLDWNDLCEQLSDGDWLAVKHVNSSRDHVHVWIETPSEDYTKVMRELRKELASPVKGKQGPVKEVSKTVDRGLLSYMCKEEQYSDNIVANKGFTGPEIEELHRKSVEYVRQLKVNLSETVLEAIQPYDSPEALHRQVLQGMIKYYMGQDKCFPPNMRARALTLMLQTDNSPSVTNYVMQKYLN